MDFRTGKSKLSSGKKSGKKKSVQSSMMNFVSKSQTTKPVAAVKPVVAVVSPFNSTMPTTSSASLASRTFKFSNKKPILPFANTSTIDLTSDSSRDNDDDFEVENRDPQASEGAESPSFGETPPQREIERKAPLEETIFSPGAGDDSAEFSLFDDDDDDLLNSVDQIETHSNNKVRSKTEAVKEKHDWADEIFGTTSPLVKQDSKKHPLAPVSTRLQFKSEMNGDIDSELDSIFDSNVKSEVKTEIDNDCKSDIDTRIKSEVITETKAVFDSEAASEDICDNDEDEMDGIDLSQDKDEYEAPLDQLGKDMCTDMTQRKMPCPWDDDSEGENGGDYDDEYAGYSLDDEDIQDDKVGGYNLDDNGEHMQDDKDDKAGGYNLDDNGDHIQDDNAGQTLDYCSPSHSPPRPALLMTCKMEDGDVHDRLQDMEKSPRGGGSIDQEVFDPTPEKPKFLRRASRSSLATRTSVSTVESESKQADLSKLLDLVKSASELSSRLGKGRLFHKNVSRMTLEDAEKHRKNLADLVRSNSEIFMEWPLDDPVELPQDAKSSIEEMRETMKKLKVKIEHFDKIQEEKAEAMREMERFNAPDDDFIPPSPGEMEEESPPFERSPPPSPVYMSSQRVKQTSPPLIQKSVNQVSESENYTEQLNDNTIAPKSKFTFKKPGLSANSSVSSLPESKLDRPVHRSVSVGGTFDFNNPNASKASFDLDSSITKPTSLTKSSYFNAKGPSNLNSTSSSFGTQFIEDVSTQHDTIVRQDPMAKTLANKPDRFNASISRKKDEFGETNMTSEIYSTQRFQSPTPVRQKSVDINSEGTFIGSARNDGKDAELSREDYPFSQEVHNVMVKKFGIRSFRPNQLQAVNSAMLGKDTFVLMPTGGGKSLCYQLPATVQGGVTVVISPLVSLIHDQVTKLNALGIAAAELTGEDYSKQSVVFTHMRSSNPGPTLLYVTPEKIAASETLNQAFESVYNRNCLQRFVIDEAHCVSQWGHDFRPDYKKLNLLRQKFPNVPFMALTATATPRVRTDILFQLGMKAPKWFLSSFNRSNLKYEVRTKKGKTVSKEIIDEIQRSHSRESGIVYCLSRKDCDTMAEALSAAGIKALAYHAGLSSKDRSRVQDDWIQDNVRVVCATIAFGMGIDKPDVRYVIHAVLPKSIEGYYQESGRAGRDSDPSMCILFYNYSDVHRLRKLIDMGENSTREVKKTHYDNLYAMVGYCENITDCRRVLQLSYFGEVFDSRLCGEKRGMMCDNCTRATRSNVEHQDITELAREIIMAVQRLNAKQRWDQKNFTINHLVDIWRGAKNAKIRNSGWDQDPLYSKGNSWNITEANRIIRKLVLEGFLWEELVITRDQMASAYVKLGTKAGKLLSRAAEVKVTHQVESKKTAADRMEDNSSGDTGELLEMQRECLDELKQMVYITAKDLNPGKQISSVNVIIPITALTEISMQLPTTWDKLKNISQITEARCGPYVEVILTITEKYHNMRLEYLKRQAINKQVEEDKDAFSSFDNVLASQGSSGGTSKYFKGKRGGSQGKRGGGGWKGKSRGGSKRKAANQGGSQPKRQSLDKGRGGSSGRARGGSVSRGRGGTSGSMGLPSGNRFGAGAAGAGAWL